MGCRLKSMRPEWLPSLRDRHGAARIRWCRSCLAQPPAKSFDAFGIAGAAFDQDRGRPRRVGLQRGLARGRMTRHCRAFRFRDHALRPPHQIQRDHPSMSGARSSAGSDSRLLWLDGFRGAAVLLMIETHVVNTFLARNLRDPAWFGWLNYMNGIVAPSFLFIAGFAVGLAMRGGSGRPVAFGRRAIRLSGILALGYALHFPLIELSRGQWEKAWIAGTQVDVLPCIAVALAVLTGAQWITRRLSGSAGERAWRRRWSPTRTRRLDPSFLFCRGPHSCSPAPGGARREAPH